MPTFPSGEAGVRPRGSGGCAGPSCALVPGRGRGQGGHAGIGGGQSPLAAARCPLRERTQACGLWLSMLGLCVSCGARERRGGLPSVPSAHPRWLGTCHLCCASGCAEIVPPVSAGDWVTERGCCEPPCTDKGVLILPPDSFSIPRGQSAWEMGAGP